MENTAMTDYYLAIELEWIKNNNSDFSRGVRHCMDIAKKYLPKERQQIEDAYKQGRKDDVLDYYPEKHASEYYEETYGK